MPEFFSVLAALQGKHHIISGSCRPDDSRFFPYPDSCLEFRTSIVEPLPGSGMGDCTCTDLLESGTSDFGRTVRLSSFGSQLALSDPDNHSRFGFLYILQHFSKPSRKPDYRRSFLFFMRFFSGWTWRF